MCNSKCTFPTSPLPMANYPAQESFLPLFKKLLKSCPGFSPKTFLIKLEFFLLALLACSLASKGSLPSQFTPSPKRARSYLNLPAPPFAPTNRIQTSPGTCQLAPSRQASALRGRVGGGHNQQRVRIKPGTLRELSP